MAERSAPHPILHIDQKHKVDKENVEYWNNELKHRDEKNHDLQVSLWVVSGVAAIAIVAVVVLAFGRKEFHYRDVTDALGNTHVFGIRSVDAHDAEAVKLVLDRYIRGIRLVTKDANYQYTETNAAWKMSRIKAQRAVTDNFAKEGKPEDLSGKDVSRNVIHGTVEIALQTGNTFSARWVEETRNPTTGTVQSQYAGSGTIELKEPNTLKGAEREASPLGIFVNEFSFSEIR